MNSGKVEIEAGFDDYHGPFSGIVSIHEKHKLIFSRCFGYVNMNDKKKINNSTKFGMASGSKIFTAVIVLYLIEKKKIGLDWKLSDFIKGKDHLREISIQSLLTHTSGIFDYFDEDLTDDYAALWKDHPMYLMKSPVDFLQLFIDKPLKFKPKIKFSYSNSGYVVLAYIIECVTEKHFAMVAKEAIFDKLNMKETGYYSLDALPSNTALGYIYDNKNHRWKTNIYSIPIIGSGDGGCFTTVKDMDLFWNGLFSNEVLSSDLTQEMLRIHRNDAQGNNYGLGVWIKKGEEHLYYVEGYDPGVVFTSFHNAIDDRTVTIASNNGKDISGMIKQAKAYL